MVEGIYGFFDEYRFLSNFAGPGFFHDGLWFPTNEHFYQAWKVNPETYPDEFEHVRTAPTAGQAKRRGRGVPIIGNWDEVKDEVMWAGLRAKFDPISEEQEQAVRKLMATGYRYLEETNTWGDTYWGVCRGEGLNRLGIQLMELRGVLR